MKLTLFEIEQSQMALIETLIDNGGELTEDLELALALNRDNLETKGTNYGFIVKQLQGECSIIDSEIARLTALKKSRVKTIDKLENSLSVAMQLFDINEIKSPVLKISFRKSESVEIEDVNLIDKKYINVKTTESPDKAAIKEAIKSGEIVIGAHIAINQNIQIK